MLTEYIFWQSDGSFSFNGPFGTETYSCFEKHGFEIEIDKDDIPKLETLKGFGFFCDVKKCKTYQELYDYIEENKKYVTEELDEIKSYTTLELLLELQSFLIKALRNNLINNKKIA